MTLSCASNQQASSDSDVIVLKAEIDEDLPLVASYEVIEEQCEGTKIRVIAFSVPGSQLSLGSATTTADAQGRAELTHLVSKTREVLTVLAQQDDLVSRYPFMAYRTPRPVALSFDVGPAARHDWQGSVQLREERAVQDFSEVKRAISAKGELRFRFGACLAKRIEVRGSAETRRQDPRGFEITVDAKAHLFNARSNEILKTLELELHIENADGQRASARLQGLLSLPFILSHLSRWRKVAEEGLADAPAYNAHETNPLLAFRGRQPDLSFLQGARVRDARLIAHIEGVESRAGRCGPYTGDGPKTLPRFRRDAQVTVVAAQSGKTLWTKTFQGTLPPCPDSVRDEDAIRGEMSETPVNLWLASLTRPAPEPTPVTP